MSLGKRLVIIGLTGSGLLYVFSPAPARDVAGADRVRRKTAGSLPRLLLALLLMATFTSQTSLGLCTGCTFARS